MNEIALSYESVLRELERERQQIAVLELNMEIVAQREQLENARQAILGLAGSDEIGRQGRYLDAKVNYELCEELLSDLERRSVSVLEEEDSDGWKMIRELASP